MTANEDVAAYTADAVRAAEAPLIEAGVPLMQQAAEALALVVRDAVADAVEPRVLVLAGSGDNGGDALFAAAHLTSVAYVDVVLVSDRVHREALAAALAAGAELRGAGDVCARPGSYAVIVDGILGIGARADARLRGVARGVVETLLPLARDPRTRVIAVDIPSGLHPDDGAADDAVLPAGATVTFGAVKAGLVRGRGPALAGEVHLVDLGLGPALERVRPAVTGPIRVVQVLGAAGARRQRA